MYRYLLLLSFVAVGCCATNPKGEGRKPNVIFILADDLGYGDLSCYGQTHFQTPNIDQLGKEGMKFTHFYAGSPVCAPSRSTLLTGLHTGHTPIRGNLGVKPEGQFPLSDTLFTLPLMFKKAGYVNGAFGKWGLGFPGSTGDPLNQGFDEFFGYNCQTLAHNYYPDHLYHNREKVVLNENSGTQKGIYSAALIHQKALDFIVQNKDTSFFLFIPTVLPHAELVAPNAQMNKFRGRYLPEKVYEGVDSGPKYRKGPYGSQPESHAAYVAMVDLLDQQVGEIEALVKKLGLDNNTIIVFTSDNGPHREGGGDPDYFDCNGPFKGYKRDLFEGGIREPFIVKWPGSVTAGSTSQHIAAFWDVMPTFAKILNINIPTKTDGISFYPTLINFANQPEHPFLYWEFYEMNGRIAVLKGDWKYIKYEVATEPVVMLFNIKDDVGEEHNLALQHPEIVKELDSLATMSHVPSPDFTMKAEKVSE
jgi:arylsulfatase A